MTRWSKATLASFALMVACAGPIWAADPPATPIGLRIFAEPKTSVRAPFSWTRTPVESVFEVESSNFVSVAEGMVFEPNRWTHDTVILSAPTSTKPCLNGSSRYLRPIGFQKPDDGKMLMPWKGVDFVWNKRLPGLEVMQTAIIPDKQSTANGGGR